MVKRSKVCTVTPSVLRVAAYVRVSTDEQAESRLGLEAQMTQCVGMSLAKSWPAPTVYADPGVSGAKDVRSRPEMARLFAAIEARQVDVLIVPSLDRIGRKAGIVINFVEELAQHDVKLVSCKESLDTSTPQGQFMLNIFASLAQMERDVTIERTKAALDARGRRDGDKGGRIPYGYKRIFELREVDETGIPKRVCVGVEIDESEAKIVHRIFTLHRRGKSLREIGETIDKPHTSVAEILKNKDAYKGGKRGESDVRWPAILK